MKKFGFVLFVSLCLTSLAFGQDLNRLQGRAQKLLDLRSTVNINKTLAAQYIQPTDRQEFLESRPFPMKDAQVIGLEFTADPKVVYVVFKALVVLPEIGAVPRTGREPWVWDKKDWFLRAEDLGNPFLESRNAPAVPPAQPLSLELSPKRVELGKHVQGEILKGMVEFRSSKDRVFLFRPPDLPGLAFNAPVWKSMEEGYIEFELDTTLISEDLHYVGEFEVDGFEGQRTKAPFELAAQIEPRLRLTQDPPVIDPGKTGPVEIRVENLSDRPFSFKNILLASDAYRLVKEPPETITPGQTVVIAFEHSSQPEAIGAQFHFELSEPIVGKRRITFPLKVKLPEAAKPGYTREQLEEIIRRTKK